MNAFSQYANFYDLLYRDKDYSGETTFVEQLIKRYSPDARSILDLGCGTARHAIEFAQRGYAVDGVDVSPQMINLARTHVRGLPAETQKRLNIIEGDISQYVSSCRHGVVTALFHVACYQTSNRALIGLFETARNALGDDGTFIFDFWYGPAVLSDRPQTRIKRIDKDGMQIIRMAEPVLHVERNVVDVAYTLIVFDDTTGNTRQVRENHTMRYLFLPELNQLADNAGFDLVETGVWLSGNVLSADTWLGYAVCSRRAAKAEPS